MKALICAKCVDIRALDPEGKWTVCRCGNTEARWIDPQRGTVSVRAKDKSMAFMLGLNNNFLVKALEGFSHTEHVYAGDEWEVWRELHKVATTAPGYIFDDSKRACWACIVRIGETNDIRWEPEEHENASE